MGKKDQTATTSQTQSYTPAGYNQLQDVWNKIQGVTSQAYQPYTGQLTAGLDPTQQAGINTITAAAGSAQPYFNQAADYARGAASSINPMDINRYMSPYTQQVVDATQRQFAENNAQQQQQVVGNAALKGALGGDRVGVAQAELARQQKIAQDPTIAGLYNQGYTQALGAAQADRSAQAQGASLFGALAPSIQNTAIQGGQAQMGAGAVAQGTDQAALNAAYQQYLQQQAFPYQQAQFLAQYGIPAITAMGGTQSGQGTQTTPGPSPFGQIAGLGISALGAFSDERVKDNIEKVGKTFDGQNIYSFTYKGDETPRMGLMAQEVEKNNPEAVGEVGGVKTVNYRKATEKAAAKGKFARGGAVDYLDVPSYVPDDQERIVDLSPKMSPMQMPGSSQQSGYIPSSGDIKGMMGGMKSLFGGISDLFPSQGGNYAANMMGPAMTGSTGMVVGGLKDGGAVIEPGFYADGGKTFASPEDLSMMRENAPLTPERAHMIYDAYERAGGGKDASDNPFVKNSLYGVMPWRDLNIPISEKSSPLHFLSKIFGRDNYADGGSVTPYSIVGGQRVDDLVPLSPYASAIGSMESGNRYGIKGPATRTGDRALGRYQVMGANVGPWTKEILGQEMTPEEFAANPAAQDTVFSSKFGEYENKHGPEGAARAWFAGEGGMNDPNRKDVLGTSVADYGKRFAALSGMPPQDGAPISMASADDAAIPEKAILNQSKGSEFGGFNPFNLSDDARLGLIAAGLGMAASKSPFALTQIGEGGLKGIAAYAEQKKERGDREDRRARIDLEAKRLAQSAEQNAKELASREKYQQGMLERGKYQYLGQTADGESAVFLNQNTGQIEERTVKIKPKTGGDLSPGQKAVDSAFAKDYAAFVSGGFADAQKSLDQLDGVIRDFKSGKENLTGPIIGSLPNSVASVLTPKAVAAREAVEEVVQRNLRLILGAQFTEKEGERLISRAYNPKLSEAENAKRLERLHGAMKKAFAAKMEAAKYYEENGSLKGFKGSAQVTAADLEREMEGGKKSVEPSPQSSGSKRPQGVPEGSAYSPSRKQWRSPDGTVFDERGERVQ